MLKEERHKIILREINLHNKVLLTDLKDHLPVSEDTIRRDLNELADMGLASYVVYESVMIQKKAFLATAIFFFNNYSFLITKGSVVINTSK
jgi:DeoR/GlpR family transcriptional regulator of sugar metabolism